jgi:hypothetical protein
MDTQGVGLRRCTNYSQKWKKYNHHLMEYRIKSVPSLRKKAAVAPVAKCLESMEILSCTMIVS